MERGEGEQIGEATRRGVGTTQAAISTLKSVSALHNISKKKGSFLPVGTKGKEAWEESCVAYINVNSRHSYSVVWLKS